MLEIQPGDRAVIKCRGTDEPMEECEIVEVSAKSIRVRIPGCLQGIARRDIEAIVSVDPRGRHLTCPLCGHVERRGGPLGQTIANRLARHMAQCHEFELKQRKLNASDRVWGEIEAIGLMADLTPLLWE